MGVIAKAAVVKHHREKKEDKKEAKQQAEAEQEKKQSSKIWPYARCPSFFLKCLAPPNNLIHPSLISLPSKKVGNKQDQIIVVIKTGLDQMRVLTCFL